MVMRLIIELYFCWIDFKGSLQLPEAGYFLMSSLELKINRITKADKHFIDAAKQVNPEPMLIAK
jgi:hypothetical protein